MSKRVVLAMLLTTIAVLAAASGFAGYLVGASDWARWLSYHPKLYMYRPANQATTTGEADSDSGTSMDRRAAEMIIAASDGEEDRLRDLAKMPMQLNYRPEGYCYNALLVAVLSKQVGAVRVLLAAGADRTVRDCKGRTPLDIAQQQGSKDIINLLDSH